MPQQENQNVPDKGKETQQPRNESAPGKTPVGTNTSEELNAENSADVRDALNESQL